MVGASAQTDPGLGLGTANAAAQTEPPAESSGEGRAAKRVATAATQTETQTESGSAEEGAAATDGSKEKRRSGLLATVSAGAAEVVRNEVGCGLCSGILLEARLLPCRF